MPKRNRRFWSRSSERILIDLWRENKDTLKNRKDTASLEKIVEQMQKIPTTKSSNFTVQEVKHKMHNFTQKYRVEKSYQSRFGEPSEWLYYQDMQELVDGMDEYMSDGEGNSNQFSMHESCSSESSSEEPLAAKRSRRNAGLRSAAAKKDTFADTLLRNIEIIESEMVRVDTELKETTAVLLEMEQKKIDLLEKYVNDASKAKNAFLEYIMKH